MSWLFLKRAIGIVIFFCLLGSLLWVPRFDAAKVDVGITFVPSHISARGLAVHEIFEKVVTDIKPDYVRVPVEWKSVEGQQSEYNFDEIIKILNAARRNQTRVILVLGHQISDPFMCNEPSWLSALSSEERSVAFRNLMLVTSSRLKAYQSLAAWEIQTGEYDGCENFEGDSLSEVTELIAARDTRPIISNEIGGEKKWVSVSVSKSWKPPIVLHKKLDNEGYFKDDRFVLANISETEKADALVSEVSYARAIGANVIFLGNASEWYVKSLDGDSSWMTIVKNIIKLM